MHTRCIPAILAYQIHVSIAVCMSQSYFDQQDSDDSSDSATSGQSGMKAEEMQSCDTSNDSMSDPDAKAQDSDSHEVQPSLLIKASSNEMQNAPNSNGVLQATPKSDTTAVDQLGASRSAAVQPHSETSSGSIKQEQDLQQQHDGPMKDAAEPTDAANAPAITAAEAAKTRQKRARKPTAVQMADLDVEPPVRRRASILKERQRDQAASEQTDEDPVYRPQGKGKSTKAKPGSKKQAAAASASDRTKAAKATLPPVMEESPEPPEEMDILLGCTKCRYLKGGCGACRDKPSLERPKSLRWKPDASRQQKVSLFQD